MSSALTIDLNMSHAFDMSSVYMMNNKGPRIEPWRTPVVMFTREDLTPIILQIAYVLIGNYLVELDRYL